MARACRFTTPYSSREIYLDGPSPTHVDDVSREIKKLLCGEKRTKSSFAGSRRRRH